MIIGVDIGGTKTAVAGFARDECGRLERVSTVRTADTPSAAGGPAVVSAVAELISEQRGTSDVSIVGVGTAGVVGDDGGISSATDALAGWAGFPLREALKEAVGIDVVVVNDVHAAAVAEAELGAAATAGSMLMAAVGTGIGGAVVLSDGLRRGSTGTAGSLGHVQVAVPDPLSKRRCPCGGRGHVEAVASGPALERTYFERTGVRASLREIDRSAQGGDLISAEVISEGAGFLGQGLASANALLDVDMIVIGGGVAEIGERYLTDVLRSYRAAAMPGPARAHIVAAGLRVNAALTGAAVIAESTCR